MVTAQRRSPRPPLLRPRFINWSRLHPQKGHDRAIRLIDALVRRGIDAHLEIWGADNGAGAALASLAKSLALTERVQFAGLAAPEEIPKLASNGAFFLQLSRYEGMAMAVVEAMQLGLVPVVTPVGQIPSYVRDNANGILVDPEQLDCAADRLQEVLADPDAFRALSTAAAAQWNSHPLYADEFCAAASDLAGKVG
jgi:glycosyltransferase involved in cell wall biosynthesis